MPEDAPAAARPAWDTPRPWPAVQISTEILDALAEFTVARCETITRDGRPIEGELGFILHFADGPRALAWHCRSKTFGVICNDWFDWGSADWEDIQPGDGPLLRQTAHDLRALEASQYSTELMRDWGLLLFACRKRKQRPMEEWYPDSEYCQRYKHEGLPKVLVPLFNAAEPDESVAAREAHYKATSEGFMAEWRVSFKKGVASDGVPKPEDFDAFGAKWGYPPGWTKKFVRELETGVESNGQED